MTAPTSARPGRNEPCLCGSGRKYKHCCLAKDEKKSAEARVKAAAAAEVDAQAPEETAKVAKRPPKPETHQPWRATTSRGFVPKARTPRKVGGG